MDKHFSGAGGVCRTHREFFGLFGDLEATRSRDGFNPVMEECVPDFFISFVVMGFVCIICLTLWFLQVQLSKCLLQGFLSSSHAALSE